MQPRDSHPERTDTSRQDGSPRSSSRSLLGKVLLQGGRGLMLLVLLVAALAVSRGLASEGGGRPTTAAVDGPAPTVPSSTVRTIAEKRAAAARTAGLVSAEDVRVLGLVRQVPYLGSAYRVSTKAADTVVLTARTAPYTRTSLLELGALIRRDNGTDYLQSSVLVAPGARLHLGGVRPIRMRSDARGFVSIVAWKGELRLTGTAARPLQISSWSTRGKAADTDETNGRAYIRTVESRTVLAHTELSDLGFWSGRTGGLSVEGGAQSAASAGAAAAAFSALVDGVEQMTISDTTSQGLHYGLYTHDVRSGSVQDVQVLDSTVQGLLLHGKSHNISVDSATVRHSGTDGVAVARGTHDVVLRDVTSIDNGADGLRVDGRPGSARPTAGGGDPVPHGDVQVSGATLSRNADSGAAVVGAVRVALTSSKVSDNQDGVTVREGAQDVRITGNTVSGSRGFGIGVTDGPSAVVVEDNSVRGGATGVAVRSAMATVQRNSVSGVTSHAISVAKRAAGSRIVDNRLAGIGSSAVGLSRLVAPSTVLVDSNDESAWDVHKDLTWSQRLAEHPLLLLWLPILLLPLAAWVVTLRRRRANRRGQTAGQPVVRRTGGRLAAADTGTAAELARTNHPAVVDPEPDTRTRVTVMA